MNMPQSAISCRLCINFCNTHNRSLYENGRRNEVYELAEKYFTSMFLDMECGRHLTVICIDCWDQILAFHTFQQYVFRSQEKLVEMGQQASAVFKTELDDSSPSTDTNVQHGVRLHPGVDDTFIVDFLANTTYQAVTKYQSTLSCNDNKFDLQSETVIKSEVDVPINEYKTAFVSEIAPSVVHSSCSNVLKQSPVSMLSQGHGNVFKDDDDNDVSLESDNTDEDWKDFDDSISDFTIATLFSKQQTTLSRDTDTQSEAVVVKSEVKSPPKEEDINTYRLAPITIDVLRSNELLTPAAEVDMSTNGNDAVANSQEQANVSMGVAVAEEVKESERPIKTLEEVEYGSHKTTDTESDSLSESEWSDESHLATDSKGKTTNKSHSRRPKHKSYKQDLKRPKTVGEFDDLIASWQPNLQCVICSETCSRFTLLAEHFGKLHPNESCHIRCCQKDFYHRYEIESHIYYHQEPNAYKCEVCCICFTSSNTLREHLRKKHSGNAEETFECRTCSKCYISKKGYEHHKRYHCDFDRNQALKDSSQRHACSKCGKSYKWLKTLHRHKSKVHLGLIVSKSFKCTICDKVYQSPSDLRDHLSAHTGKNNHTCPYCPNTFMYRSHVHKHLKRVHRKEWEDKKAKKENRVIEKKIYNCTTCKKAYKTPLALREHMAHHTGKKMYTCKQCSKVFKYSSNLYADLKNVHRKKKND